MPNSPRFGTAPAPTEASVSLRSRSRVSDCRIPYGAITRLNPGRERNGSDRMSPRTSRARACSRARRQPQSAAAQHLRRPIDPDDLCAGPRDRHRDPSSAAAQLEHWPILRGGEPLPELHVAARDRLRILPVVERRIAVPPFPSLRTLRTGAAAPSSCAPRPLASDSRGRVLLVAASHAGRCPHSSLCPTVANSIVFWISTKDCPAAAASAA